MSIATASELTGMQAIQRAEMTATMTISRPVPGAWSATGQYASTLTPVASNVPCRFAPAGSPAERLADAIQASLPLLVFCPVGTDVRPTDTLTVTHGIAGIPSPLTLQVVGVEYRIIEASRQALAIVVSS